MNTTLRRIEGAGLLVVAIGSGINAANFAQSHDDIYATNVKQTTISAEKLGVSALCVEIMRDNGADNGGLGTNFVGSEDFQANCGDYKIAQINVIKTRIGIEKKDDPVARKLTAGISAGSAIIFGLFGGGIIWSTTAKGRQYQRTKGDPA